MPFVLGMMGPQAALRGILHLINYEIGQKSGKSRLGMACDALRVDRACGRTKS